MKNKLEKHYDVLNAAERINLSIAALAREDYEEFAKLCDSCKKAYYTKPDINYSGKIERLLLISFWYKLSCANFAIELLQKMSSKDALESNVTGYKKGVYDAFIDDENITEDHPILLKAKKHGFKCHKKMLKIEKDINKTISKFVALNKALKLFCEETEICFNNMLAWVISTDKGNFEEIPDFSDIEADKDVLEQVVSEFRRLWGKKNNSYSTIS